MARRMMNASVCAYQIYEAGVIPAPHDPGLRHIQGADDRFFYQVVPAYQDAVGFDQPSANYAPDFIACGHDFIDGALVGVTQDGYLVVAIRGTLPPSFNTHDIREWMADWAGDADMHPVDWPDAGPGYGMVEHGFSKAAIALWPFVKDRIEALLPQAPKGVLITGHSKGGAVTYLMASLIRATWPDLAGRIAVHAFAPALACNAAFSARYDAQGLSERTVRYQVAGDLVPFVPLWSGADVWAAVFKASPHHKLLWGAMTASVYAMTRGGYVAPGRLVYFDADHNPVLNADIATTAMPYVVDLIVAGDYKTIGAAHSATESYLPCFPAEQSAQA